MMSTQHAYHLRGTVPLVTPVDRRHRGIHFEPLHSCVVTVTEWVVRAGSHCALTHIVAVGAVRRHLHIGIR